MNTNQNNPHNLPINNNNVFTITATINNNSNISNELINKLQNDINGEKFKDLCLKNDEKQIKKLLNQLFDVDKDLNVSDEFFNLLKQYMSGGMDFNEYRNEGKTSLETS